MIEDDELITDDNIARVRDLLACMQKGNEEDAIEIIDELTTIRETELYQDMGKLTRELHDAISNFGMDDSINIMAEQSIPDARERLKYVISKTDEAANKTLEAVEESIPICDNLNNKASELHESWKKFTNRELSADEFRTLSKDISHFFDKTAELGTVKDHLTSVLLAQEYQDLTGQIIKKVINLVGEVEDKLVGLIKITGAPQVTKKSGGNAGTLDGPPVPGIAHKDTVSGQDEVDDLLSSLGF
ncbi:MAG: protein phosphatase CheZ [Gammaproteobacteria bacterium]|nr:protein phosphatase CheZ [Gammaproteobacteria bacterium]